MPGFSEGSRRFDSGGRAEPAPAYRKVLASGYVEYGWRSWLTLVAAPTLSRADSAATNQVTGSDGSAFGGRLMLYARPGEIISLQALVQPPLGGDRAAQLASGGTRTLAGDLRLQVGQGFALFGWSAFVEMAPGFACSPSRFPTKRGSTSPSVSGRFRA